MMVSKFFKILLIALVALLVVLLAFGLALLLGWPLWVGVFLLLGFVGIGIGVLFIRKIWLRRREQAFVQQVIAQDEAHLRMALDKEREELKELQERWKEALDTLRRSHLRRHGNPLYVLPWYLIMGESGSGKTTALSSAKLSSPFVEVHRTSGISGTRSCDWWFFEQAIVLDTAGRYAIPVDQGKDKEEWQRFLSLLVKYRKKEPINGLIVTIAADRVVQAPADALEEEGRTIRQRIDELMRVLGAKFPVYLLTTKCDLLQGMTQFCDRLTDKILDQPVGFINQELSTDAIALVDRAIDTIGERLRNLRLLLLHQPESKAEEPAFLLFPEEFENLKQGLQAFVRGAFKQNPYQETPVLRGLFFSSGRQEGSPYSRFLSTLGLIGQKEVLPGTSRGLFLHDFFSKVLPRDRGLLAPTTRAIQWRMLTRNLGLASWIILGLAMCGLMSFSFVKNLKAIREVPDEFARPLPLTGETTTDLTTLNRFAKAILTVEDKNTHWWIPRFGLNESTKVENGLKHRYCTQFQDVFLASFDKRMAEVMAGLTAATPDEVIGQYAAHLVRRINLLKGRREGQGFETLKRMPQPSLAPLLPSVDKTAEPNVREQVGSLYLYYLVWQLDAAGINKEVDLLQAWLRRLLAQRKGDLRWLAVWVNRDGSIPSITLNDFWGGIQSTPSGKSIVPAFTRQGKGLIDSFLKEMEEALPDPMLLATPRLDFEKWYRPTCIEAWQSFGAAFSQGTQRLKGPTGWQQMATRVTTSQGPYFSLLSRMAQELEPTVGTEGLPGWLQKVYHFQIVKAQAGQGGVLDKAAEEGKKIVSTLEKAVGRTPGQEVEAQVQAVKAYQEYQSALDSMAVVAASKNQAYQLSSQTFSEEPAVSKSPVFAAQRAASTLRASLVGGNQGDDIFWSLLTGPLSYLWTYAMMETACYLQGQWENTVIAEVSGVSGQEAIQLLLAPDGHVWKFVKGPAAPFLGRNLRSGYFARELMAASIPFKPPFFTFLTKGAIVQAHAASQAKRNYSVSIEGLPTDANPEARFKPQASRLELECAGGSQSLVNLNYPVRKTFVWAPDTCSDVLLQIEVSDIVLVKRYPGPEGFPDFLRDFRDGRRVFYSREFPAERASLERLAIRNIRVNYNFTGAQAVLGQMGTVPGQAPRIIAQCWEQ